MNARILLPGAPFGGGPSPSAVASMNQQHQQQNLEMSNNNFIEKLITTDEKLTENIELPTENNNNNIKAKEKTPMCLIAELVRYNKVRATFLAFVLTDQTFLSIAAIIFTMSVH